MAAGGNCEVLHRACDPDALSLLELSASADDGCRSVIDFKDDGLMLLATGRPREAFPSLTTTMVIAFCAIYALMATASAGMSQPEWGFDRPGQDYHHFQTSGWRICSAACASQEPCRAYTFVMPTRPGANGICWLKAGVAKRSASNCCISGVRVRSAERIDGDRPGHDLRAGSPVQWADDRLPGPAL